MPCPALACPDLPSIALLSHQISNLTTNPRYMYSTPYEDPLFQSFHPNIRFFWSRHRLRLLPGPSKVVPRFQQTTVNRLNTKVLLAMLARLGTVRDGLPLIRYTSVFSLTSNPSSGYFLIAVPVRPITGRHLTPLFIGLAFVGNIRSKPLRNSENAKQSRITHYYHDYDHYHHHHHHYHRRFFSLKTRTA